jgi:hypothetical protein
MTLCRRDAITLLMLLTLAGCQNAVQPLAEDDTPVTPDTPLMFKLDGKNRIFIKDRWVELFSEHNAVVEYVKNRQQRYQLMFDQYEIGLPQYRHGKKMLPYFPVEVIVEVDSKVRSGAVSSLRRVCREHGFINFVVKPLEGETPDVIPGEKPKETAPGQGAKTQT